MNKKTTDFKMELANTILDHFVYICLSTRQFAPKQG